MPRDRFFVEGVHAAGDRIVLAPDAARKLVTVLRRGSGERVQIVDAAGTAYTGVLDVMGKAVAAVLEAPVAAPSTDSAARIVIAQGIPKGQKMDFIVEKATELGASAIVPLRSERVAGDRTGDHKHERWQRIAATAAAQSGRSRVPTVEQPADWPALIATFSAYDAVYLLWDGARASPLRDRFEAEAAAARAILCVIGPEGGFSPQEIARAAAAGAVSVSLGRRILRTETAALVVLAALLYARGEL